MFHEFLVLLFAIVCGFVASGVCASFYRLVMRQQGEFRIAASTAVGKVFSVGLIGVAGPVVLFQNTLVAYKQGSQPRGALAIACALVSLWSFALGLFILQLGLALSNSHNPM